MSGNVLEIMHKNRRVAKIDMSGRCKIYYKSFMPYNLYLEEEEDIDTLVNNITNCNQSADLGSKICKRNSK